MGTTYLLSAEAVSDPYGVYAALREQGPVVWLPEHHAWMLTTYHEVQHAFRDARLASDRLTPLEQRLDPERRARLGQTFELLRGWMVFQDPPHHERMREPLRRAFTPRTVERLRPHVHEIVDELLSGIAERGEVDLVADYAFPLPAIVIAELLGVPVPDRERFRTWSAQLAAIVFGSSNRADQAEAAAEGSAQFADYFAWLIRKYTDEPADNLVSALIAVTHDDAARGGDGLTASELVGACTLLLFAGHETTAHLIGSGTLALLQHPAELAWLRDHLDLIGPAVEELLRYDGPTMVMPRAVGVEHERHGSLLQPGQSVFLCVAGANHDPAAFSDPDRLWLARPDAGKHLGFGYGIHYCLGAPLARLEGQIAIGALVQRFPQLALAREDVDRGASILGRGLRTLPVTVG